MTAFTLLYACAGAPLGRLSDRWERPKILELGAATWRLLTAASGMASSYRALFAARSGVGIGEASCAPASNSLIGDLYPAQKRALFRFAAIENSACRPRITSSWVG